MSSGAAAALGAAALFGAGTPLAKLLLGTTGPWLLAALLYLGSGIGLWALRRWRRAEAVRLAAAERAWLAAAVVAGGVVGPVLLMTGLAQLPAAAASLLLNAEGVLTALLAWFVFRENVDRRVAVGFVAIVAGSGVLSWPGADANGAAAGGAAGWPALAVLGACLAWAIDNNLTRKVAHVDATFIAMTKGLAAGATNLVLALASGAVWPGPATVAAAAALGFASYGASLVLFVVGLRRLGTARTAAYFSVAPFFGAALAVGLLGEAVTWHLVLAAALMAIGVALHLAERHLHEHVHETLRHDHAHTHGLGDEHHDHPHDDPHDDPASALHAAPPGAGVRHAHAHRHAPLRHSHAHVPDVHHRHPH